MVTPPINEKPNLVNSLRRQKWLTLIVLPILIYAMIKEIYWVWGILFVYWGLYSIRTQEVYLLETIQRDDDPLLYWLIVALWIGSGIAYIHSSFFPAMWL